MLAGSSSRRNRSTDATGRRLEGIHAGQQRAARLDARRGARGVDVQVDREIRIEHLDVGGLAEKHRLHALDVREALRQVAGDPAHFAFHARIVAGRWTGTQGAPRATLQESASLMARSEIPARTGFVSR